MPNANTKAVTQASYNAARAAFQSHYFLENCDTDFGGQDFQVPWDDFADKVDSFINSNQLDPDSVALRFVHCYDAANNNLYVRLQICTMVLQQNSGNVYNLVTTPSAWYVIQDGSIETTEDTSLQDDNYLNNFYYCDQEECSSETSVLLADDGGTQFARNLVFPWGLQIARLYKDNSAPKGAAICFSACSFLNQGSGAAYPHCLVIYLRNSNNVALLNNVVTGDMYDCKGADMATICPPCCNIYVA